MEDAKQIDNPLARTTKLDLEGSCSAMEQKLYRGMIGSLLYFTASKHDIVFSVELFARFQTCTQCGIMCSISNQPEGISSPSG